MLTKKQKKLFDYLKEYISKSGISPSFEEMKSALGLKSKSGIHGLIISLEQRGFIKRLKHKARAMEIIKNESNLKDVQNSVDTTSIPFYGTIPAGIPVEANNTEIDQIVVPNTMISTNHKYFGLTVKGESMIDAGIIDGDTAIIRQTNSVNNGRIAAVLIKGEDVTLKKIKFNQSKILLIPANSSFEEKTYNATDIEIQGELKGIIRKYN